MNEIAVLSDIHGNLPALEAVLAEVAEAEVDLIVLNGDLVDGPFPGETLDLLERLGDRAVWLRGNGDRWLVEAQSGFRHPDPATDAMLQWASRRLTEGQRDRLATLPLTLTLDVAGRGPVGICHATGRSDNEMFLVDSGSEQAAAAFANFEAETVVVGHCHMPFDRLIDRRRIINTGSVGMPYGHSGASWALIGSDVVSRQTPYDVDAAASRIARSGMPGASDFARTYVRSQPSAAEALDAYRGIRSGQQSRMTFD